MRELHIEDGPLEAVVLPDAGARLHRIRAFGIDLLRTPDDPRAHLSDPFFWGAYVMAPWCNRVAPVPTIVAGNLVDLAPNFADGTAIHGQVAAMPWSVDADGTTVRIDAGGDGWPWAYEATSAASIAGPVLHLQLTLANRSRDPMPAGLGIHPWWRRPMRVAMPASQVYRSNTSPSTSAVPTSDAYDLDELTEPAFGLDATWTGLRAPRIELQWPDDGVEATVLLTGDADHVALATPRDVPAVAIEAQTHAPYGLARLLRGQSGAVRLLQPGGALRLGLEISVRRA